MSRFDEQDRKRNAGFRIGFMAGVLLVLVSIVFWTATQERGQADVLAWVLGWAILFLAARTAAERQYRSQINEINPLRGVRGAAVGAALVATAVIWVFIVVREVILDQPSLSTTLGLVRLPIDILIALGLGSLGARGTLRRYSNSHLDE